MRLVLAISFCLFSFTSALADPNVKQMVEDTAVRYKVPPKLAVKVAEVETKNKCGLVGRRGERGPLQINPKSAKSLGYGNITHASCQVQLDAGMAHLAYCYKLAKGNWFRTAACHNGGPGALKRKKLGYNVRKYVQSVMR